MTEQKTSGLNPRAVIERARRWVARPLWRPAPVWVRRVSWKNLAKWYYAGVAVIALAALITMFAVYRTQLAQLNAGTRGGKTGLVAGSKAPAQTAPAGISASTPAPAAPAAATPASTPASTPAPTPAQAPDLSTITPPISGGLAVSYGWVYSKTLQDWRFHPGVDFKAIEGSPVRAALAGRVVSAGQDASLGYQVVLDNGGGLETVYACLQEVAVRPGDDLEQGQYLGKVGASALMESADGPHLHFSIYKQGEPVDPRTFLK
ncbi:MAG TPA: M23 family metallopeptidase [Bacillota bacterium]